MLIYSISVSLAVSLLRGYSFSEFYTLRDYVGVRRELVFLSWPYISIVYVFLFNCAIRFLNHSLLDVRPLSAFTATCHL